MSVLVDTNVILDLVTEDPRWADWSESMLERYSIEGLTVNPVIFSELCVGADEVEDVVEMLGELRIDLQETSLNALFLAAKAFRRYRSRGGSKISPLPDFFIGAHAADLSIPVLTRDPTRMASYFPEVELICP